MPRLSILYELGYHVDWRDAQWCECLVWRDGERFLGVGPSRETALEHALAQLLPTGAARDLFAWRLEASPTPPETAIGPSAECGPAAGETPAAVDQPATTPAPEPPADAPADQPPVPAATGGHANGNGHHPSPAAREVLLRTKPNSAKPHQYSLDEAGEIVEDASDWLETVPDTLARLNPHLIRLHFIARICQLRAIQAEYPADFRHPIQRHFKQLNGYCKTWWPGSIAIMQVDSLPSHIHRDLGAPGSANPAWSNALKLVEEALDREIDQFHELRWDDDGWADGNALIPACSNPDPLLDEVWNALAKYFGPPDQPEHDRGGHHREVSLPALLDLARKLRWIRRDVRDANRWAQAMGRIRWALPVGDRSSSGDWEAVRQALAPDFNPVQPWARVLGFDPKKREQVLLRRKVLKNIPNATSGAGTVQDWLALALALGEEMPLPRLAGLCQPMKAIVLAFEGGEIAETKSLRRRFRNLKKLLEDGGIEPVPIEAPEDAPEREEWLESQAEPAVARPEPLYAQLEPVLRGKRLLVISNRAETELAGRIGIALGASIDWEAHNPRLVDSLCNRVKSGNYDFVLGVTGFIGHSVDGKLSRTARQSGLQYVRVGKGRPVHLLQCLADRLVSAKRV